MKLSISHPSSFLLILIVSFGITTRSASAVKPYRCNGKVQFTPCEKGGASPTIAISDAVEGTVRPTNDPRFVISGKRYATLLKSNFTSLTRTTGLWSGVVKGNGLIETELQIYRNGNLEVRRYMGHVWLRNKETPFKITSALPAGRGWDWKIAVWAR